MMRPVHGRLRVPVAMLILGTGLAAAETVGHGSHDAIPIEAVAVAAAGGYFLVGGLDMTSARSTGHAATSGSRWSGCGRKR